MTNKTCPHCCRSVGAKGFAAHLASHGDCGDQSPFAILWFLLGQMKTAISMAFAWFVFGVARDCAVQLWRSGDPFSVTHPNGDTPFVTLDSIISCWTTQITDSKTADLHVNCGSYLLDGMWFTDRRKWEILTTKFKKGTVVTVETEDPTPKV